MKFSLIIDKQQEEEVIVRAHGPSALTEQIEALVLAHNQTDRIAAFTEDELRILKFSQIECITVLDGKDAMTAKWESATASAETLEPGSEATVELTEGEGGAKHFVVGVPKGEKGDKGDTGPAGVTFRLEGTVLYIDTV